MHILRDDDAGRKMLGTYREGFQKEKYCLRRIQLVKKRNNKPDNSFNWKPLKYHGYVYSLLG